jgi:hypothetical protein
MHQIPTPLFPRPVNDWPPVIVTNSEGELDRKHGVGGSLQIQFASATLFAQLLPLSSIDSVLKRAGHGFVRFSVVVERAERSCVLPSKDVAVFNVSKTIKVQSPSFQAADLLRR